MSSHLSVSKKSLFPFISAICGILICVGMFQRLRDPVYPPTMDNYIYLIAGGLMTIISLFLVRRFPWMNCIPVMMVTFVGLLTPTDIHYMNLGVLAMVILLLILPYNLPMSIIMKTLAIIVTAIPVGAIYIDMQNQIAQKAADGYLTDVWLNKFVMRIALEEFAFYLGVAAFILSLRRISQAEPA